MTQEEAIKYLQGLYPNGGHCWLDEQRIEAISMAIKALQEEPVSNDLEEAAHQYAWDKQEHHIDFDGDEYLDYGVRFDAFKTGAKWQKEQMIDKACEWLKEHKEHPLIGCEDPCLSGYLTDEFIEEFKNAMEDKL